MIQAVVLVGGRGRRLRPLTEMMPKPLLLVRGKPFLEYQFERLRGFGVTRVLLLTGYLGSWFEEHFGDGSRLGLRLGYVREETPLGTGGALRNAADKLEDEFLLLNGDTLLAIDYACLVARFRQGGKPGLLVAFENPAGDPPNNLKLAPNGRVLAYDRHNPAGLTHVDAGVGVFRREILKLIPARRVVSLEEEVYPRLIERGELWAFSTGQRFFDMGTFPGLEALLAELEAVEAEKE
ncbi:MAG: sugar phosphate nucleotidyltransferase [Candidatus Acidoferrales bacterium]